MRSRFLAIAVVMALAGTAWAQPPASSRALREEGAAAYRAGDCERAIAIYESIAAQEPGNPEIRKDLMWVLFESERYERCAEIAAELIKLAGDDREAHHLRVNALHRAGRYREALDAADRSLALNPGQADEQLARTQILEALRDYERAAAELKDLCVAHPELAAKAAAGRGRVLNALGRHAEAAAQWAIAGEAYPDRPEYRYFEAEALFKAGQVEEGIAGMKALLAARPEYDPCRDFLVRVSITQGRMDEAISLLSSQPWTDTDVDGPALLKLAGLCLQSGRREEALPWLDRALKLDPRNGEALLLKADVLRLEGQLEEAAELFTLVADANPWSERGWLGLADIRESRGDLPGALDAIRRVRQKDPTDPSLLMREARCLHAAGEVDASRALLAQFLEAGGARVLPVLLYHGLTQRADDPLLASKVHMTTRVFDAQIGALAGAGYRCVTAEEIRGWYAGESDLPSNAVWIVFDDARLDSFKEATPILKRHGMKATMFVPGCNADRNLPGYATWEELAAYRDSGVWGLQSHGDRASDYIQVSEAGRKDIFLPSLLWRTEEKRIETEQEWQERVAADFRAGWEKMERRLGARPVAFAWPEGDFGEEGIPGPPRCAAYNLEQARANFALAFHQDSSGINVRTRDPHLLTRFEPPANWSGEDLLRHLREKNPLLLARLQLLRQAVSLDQAAEARRWLEEARAQGCAEAILCMDEMRVLYLEGAWESAAAAAAKALALKAAEAAPDARALLECWNTRARCLERLGRLQEALQAFAEGLKISRDQPDVLLAVANILDRQRRYELALGTLEEVRRTHPDHAKSAAPRARVLGILARHDEAAQAWAEAAAAYPDNTAYPYFEAEELCRAGRADEGRARLRALLERDPSCDDARSFLLRDAVARGDFDAAIRLGEERPLPEGDGAAASLTALAGLYLKAGRTGDALARLDDALTRAPLHGEALLLKAEILLKTGKPAAAARIFEQVGAANAWSLRAWGGLADASLALGSSQGALDAIWHLRSLDRADTGLLLREARYLYAAGEQAACDWVLEDWMRHNAGPVLAIVLYHGLTSNENDPMLASRIHLRTGVFEEQLTALKEAGYSPVTGGQIRAWYEGRGSLPAKALWIAFDDGRLDSLREATPVLRKLGWNAAMFVAGTNADRDLPGYATWAELSGFLETGLWEFQSHGDRASDRVAVSAQGRTETALPNRMWLPESGRLESEAEWMDRIEADYRRGAEMLSQHLGIRPSGFAWPEGDFGQEGLPNAPDSAARNMAMARKYFPLAFHQDAYGLNVRTRDPMQLTRLEPRPEWSGADLVRHLEDNQPHIRVAMELLKHDVWAGRIEKARARLEDLRRLSPPDALLLTAEAMILSAAGDQASARRLLRRVSSEEAARMKDYASTLASIERQDKPRLRASFRYWADEDDRRNVNEDVSYEATALSWLRWGVAAGYGEYRDPAVEDIQETSASLMLSGKRGPGHELSLRGTAHQFSGPADDQVTWAGSWDASWSERWRTVLGLGRNLIFTGEALAAGITSDGILAEGIWSPAGAWEVRLRGAHAELSDDNQRDTAVMEVSTALPISSGLRLIGRVLHDDASRESEAYYSPQNLRQGHLGVSWQPDLGLALKPRLRYLPGYGVEDGEDSRIVHGVDLDVRWRLGERSELRPAASYLRTPSYSSAGANVSWTYRF
jgi:tetratricopeptide (TPR) repeat protein